LIVNKSALIAFFVYFFYFPTGIYSQDSTKIDDMFGFNFNIFPYVFYTPETEWAVGTAGISYFRTEEDSSLYPSKIVLSGYVSTNERYDVTLSPSFYFMKNAFSIISEIKYARIVDKFWGIGPETEDVDFVDYSSMLFSFNFEIRPDMSLFGIKSGFIYNYESNDIEDKEQNTYLYSDTIVGADGGKTGGLGLSLIFDTRNNLFSPSHGYYYQVKTNMYRDWLGSDFRYNELIADIRSYFLLATNHVLGVQAYGMGYYEGRYRDYQYMAGQVEYRTLLFWRIGAVAFFSMGDVAPNFGSFQLRSFKYAYGFGIRYMLDKKEKLNIRFDMGFGKETSGVYFAIEESF
jgi:hypothetical protein